MPKEEMKDRGWSSPDAADALALTFVSDASVKRTVAGGQGAGRSLSDSEIAEITSVYG